MSSKSKHTNPVIQKVDPHCPRSLSILVSSNPMETKQNKTKKRLHNSPVHVKIPAFINRKKKKNMNENSLIFTLNS